MTAPNLAAMALSTPKPKKADAQMLIKELAAKHPESASELAALYTYFMPSVPKGKTCKSVWDWAARAVGVNDVRFYLNYVYVTDERIVATDGHRLHMAPNADGLRTGYYLPNGDWAHPLDWANYPEIDRMIPRADVPGCLLAAEPEAFEHRGLLAVKLPGLPHGVAVNLAYLRDALAMGSYPVPMLNGGPRESVRFDLPGERLAVVMPVRV